MSLAQHSPILNALREYFRQTFVARRKKGEQPDPVDHSQLWRCIFDYAAEDSETYGAFFNLFSFYKHAVPEFCNVDPFVRSRFEQVRIEEDGPGELPVFVRMLPFLEVNMAIEVVEMAIDYVSVAWEKNGQIPFDFVRVFGDVLVEDFDYETFTQIKDLFLDFFREEESKKRFAAALVFANMAVDFQKIDSALNETITELFSELMAAEETKLQISGLYLLRKYSLRYQYEPELAPDANALVEEVLPFLNGNNNTVLDMASKTIVALVKCGLFAKMSVIEVILRFFEVLVQNSYPNYFRIIHSLIYPTGDLEEIDYELKTDNLVLIRDFLVDNIENNKSLVAKGFCIYEFENLLSLEKSLVEDNIALVFDESKKIIQSKNYAIYSFVTSFLIAVSQNYPTYKEQVEKMVMSICDLFSNSKNQYTQSIDVAIDLASFINAVVMKPPPILTSFAMHAIESKKECDSKRGCIVFLEMIERLTPKLATTVFEKAFKQSFITKEVESLTVIFELLTKLIKYYPIESKYKDNLVDILVRMEHPLVSKIPPILFEPFAKYINTYVKKCNEKIKIIVEAYVSWYMKVKQHSNLILQTIIIIIKKKDCLTEKGINNIIKRSMEILKDNNKENLNSDHVIATIDCLKALYQKNSKILPLSEIFDELMKYFDNVDLFDFTSSKIKSIMDIVPSICDFIFFVHSTDKSIEPNTTILLELIRYLPFPPEVYYNKSIINSLLLLTLNPNFDFLKKHILRVFANILILDRSELNEFKFEKELESKMRFILKKSTDDDSALKSKITKHFQNQKRDKEIFEQLIQ